MTAFDSQYSQSIGLVPEQKGAHCFSVNELSRTLALANKKKLYQYAWQSPGFALIREFSLADVPKSLLCVRNAVIVGYRKHYECLDLVTGLATRILDVEREHRMIITEVCWTCDFVRACCCCLNGVLWSDTLPVMWSDQEVNPVESIFAHSNPFNRASPTNIHTDGRQHFPA